MSTWDTLFGPELWGTIGNSLKGAAKRWWEEYEDDLVAYGEDELKEILKTLRDEGTAEAKIYIALRMDREEWEQYRDGVTDALHGIALRRARIFDALEDLGRRSARIIATVAAVALGL